MRAAFAVFIVCSFFFVTFAGAKEACAPVPAAAVLISSHHTFAGTRIIYKFAGTPGEMLPKKPAGYFSRNHVLTGA